MTIKARVIMDRGKLLKLSDAQIKAVELTAEALKTEVMSAQVVPKQVSTLEGSGFVEPVSPGKVKLVYDTPYARRLYWHPEYNFRTDKNPNARGKWLEPWIKGDKKDFARKAFRTIYRRLMRGVVK